MMMQHSTASAGAAARLPSSSSFPASIRNSFACPRRQPVSSSSGSRNRCSPRPISPLQPSGAESFNPSAAAKLGPNQQPHAPSADRHTADIEHQGGASGASAGCPFHQQDQAVVDVAPAGLTEAAAAAAGPGNDAHAHHNSNSGAAHGVANLAGPGGCWRVLPSGNTNNLPEVPGRAGVVISPEQPIGEFAELEQLGAAPFLLQRYREFGPVFSWMLGPTRMTTVVDYDAIKSLLQLGDSKVIVGWNPEAFYAMLGERTRKSLEDPATRINNRRMMQPGFTKEALAGYMDKLIKICTTQLDAWAAVDGPVDLAAEGKRLSFEFSTQLLVDFDISPEQKHQLRGKFDALFQGIFSPPDPTPGSRFSKGIEARGQLLQDIEQLVRAREAREKLSAGNGKGHGSGHGSGFAAAASARKNVFDYTLDQQREEHGTINYAEAASSGIGLIIAGNDTSGLGVSALLATLPLFPEVVQKLRQEQQQVIKRHGDAITLAALDAMPYAEAVIRETLRVAPPSAAVFRRALVDLEVCGKYVPAGSPLMLSSFMGQVLTDPRLNLNDLSPADFQALEQHWGAIQADTLRDEFKPERWMQAEGKPSGLLTFSVGPHVCLGMSLFFTEAKVLLALLARHYSMELTGSTGSKGQAATSSGSIAAAAGPDFGVYLGNVLLRRAAVQFGKLQDGKTGAATEPVAAA